MITHKQLRLLGDAINSHEGWKGNLMPEEFAEFDAQVAEMREALEAAKETRRELVALNARVEDDKLANAHASHFKFSSSN